MSIRGLSPIIGLQAKSKLFISTRQPKSIRAHSEKKFTPKINKSFTCYNEPTPYQSTADRSRFISFLNVKARSKSINKYRTIRFKSKLNSSSPNKELNSALVEKAEGLFKNEKFEDAKEILDKVLKDEPFCPSALLARGKIFMEKKEFRDAASDFMCLVDNFSGYDKTSYVLLAMSLVAIGDVAQALKKLTKGISRFPKFEKVYLARGQLFNNQMLWEKGASDFIKVINLDPENINGYLGLCDSFLGLNLPEKALKTLKSGKSFTSFPSRLLLKSSKIHFDLGNFPKSLKCINKAIKQSSTDAELYYQKALIYLKLENLSEAALCLEQVIKFDSDKKYSGAALFDLGSIRIKLRDYYGAVYTFKRATDLKVSIKPQKILEKYVEAILTLTKRKFKEGSEILTKLIKKNHPVIQEYIGNCYALRGYAHTSLEMYEKAVKDLNKSAKFQKLDQASEYNLFISQAFLHYDKKKDLSLAFLYKAKELFNKNPEPLVLEALIHFNSKNYSKSVSMLSHALSMKPSDSELHFFRAIVNYEEGRYSESIHDLDIAIDKSEENNAYHYLCRGLNYASLCMYHEALNDFSAVMQIDDKFTRAHVFRGKCAFLQDDINLAYTEFQKLLYLKPDDAYTHIQAGDLLLLNNSVKDAFKAYQNSLAKEKTKEGLTQCIKCCMILGDLPKCLELIVELLTLHNLKKRT